jgi:hypothetical protein
MLGEFLSANVSAPFLLFMVESFHQFEDEAEVGKWTGILGGSISLCYHRSNDTYACAVSTFFLTQFLTSLLWVCIPCGLDLFTEPHFSPSGDCGCEARSTTRHHHLSPRKRAYLYTVWHIDIYPTGHRDTVDAGRLRRCYWRRSRRSSGCD